MGTELFTPKYFDINEVKEITIPEEAKNGKLIESEVSYNKNLTLPRCFASGGYPGSQ